MEITVHIEAKELATSINALGVLLAELLERTAQTGAVSPAPAAVVQAAAPVVAPPTVAAAPPPSTNGQAPNMPGTANARPPVAVPVAVPTAAPSYTQTQLAVAATTLIDAGKRGAVVALLSTFGVGALTQLPQEQYGAFAAKLRELGAKI